MGTFLKTVRRQISLIKCFDGNVGHALECGREEGRPKEKGEDRREGKEAMGWLIWEGSSQRTWRFVTKR